MVGGAKPHSRRALAAAETKMSASRTCNTESLALVIRNVAIFCLTNGGHLFSDWSGEKLYKYLAFQWLSGQLIWLRDDEGEISGVLIAWREFASEILRKGPGDHFNWRPGVDGGDALMVGDVIVRKSENREAEL